MRLIKFKAWDLYRKKIWSAEEMGRDQLTINPDGRGFINVNGLSTRLSTHMTHLIPLQFIDFLDKNGKEIYEGDIVNFSQSKDFKGHIGIIGYYETGFRIYKRKEDEFPLDTDIPTAVNHLRLVIIGNIYENPELLNKNEGEK